MRGRTGVGPCAHASELHVRVNGVKNVCWRIFAGGLTSYAARRSIRCDVPVSTFV